MAGNVAEWTYTQEGNGYVVRGGSFQTPVSEGGIFRRIVVDKNHVSPEIGFRCVTGADFVDANGVRMHPG
jgi:hypothetical protein